MATLVGNDVSSAVRSLVEGRHAAGAHHTGVCCSLGRRKHPGVVYLEGHLPGGVFQSQVVLWMKQL